MIELIQGIIVALGLVGSAFFAGLETGVVAINPLRLEHLLRKKHRGMKTLQQFVEKPDHLLGTTLIGNNLCNVITSVTAVSLGTHLLGGPGYTVAYVFVTVATLLLGEYLPKAWFQADPVNRVRPFIGLLHLHGKLFYPMSKAMMALTRILFPIRTRKEKNPLSVTREELQHLTHEGSDSGSLTDQEGRMMHGVFALEQTTCGDIMVPLERIVYVAEDSAAEDVLKVARKKNLSRLPVFNPETERFIGTVYVFDLLTDAAIGDKQARDYVRPPQFARDNTPLDELLPRMRRSSQPMALVTDRHSRVVGLVTLEIILEEIIGPLTEAGGSTHGNS